MIKARFEIFKSDGYICAVGQNVGIYICDKNWNELMKDIYETVELYYGLPDKAELKMTVEVKAKAPGKIKPL
ncbi:hypothetical protein Mtc_1314 [Methanocella conradii HZ254]|uniref:Uncharacterized protein n=1 Tax=Methanocella conradii (strain DSM 24694 / JCM 17849 / CGMCC 1.5162 / HZ254) TaxID=1041930 RepID=H8I9M3_METCZ|nr:hypothetical protein [Methanocella conradii]AFD00068.1 hypothetical protein Mtc_1314 [Methanocella conradii HZ254]